MPIKCAGAPQKAMYMSCDHWWRNGVFKDIDIQFCNAGGVLFGVKEYVPALMKYVEKYNAHLNFSSILCALTALRKRPGSKTVEGREPEIIEMEFDMIHVSPPQSAPDFVKVSRWRTPVAGLMLIRQLHGTRHLKTFIASAMS